MPTSISIDASVVIKSLVEEESSGVARKLIATVDLIIVPAHAYAEIAEIIYRKRMSGLIEEAHAREALEELPRLLTLVPLDGIIGDAFSIAMDIRHSVYDCLYVAAARKHGISLVTADLKLLRKVEGTAYSSIVIPLESYYPPP